MSSFLDTTNSACPTRSYYYFNACFRIFWLIVVALSWYGSSLLIAAQYDAFQNNPISFVVETTYKDWNTEFPAVVVCENDNSNRVEAISDKYILFFIHYMVRQSFNTVVTETAAI